MGQISTSNFWNVLEAHCMDDFKPSWKTPLRNCITLSDTSSNTKKLLPRPQRLSEFSQSLSRLGIDREKFLADTIYWQDQVRHYWRLMDVNEKEIRIVMDMSAKNVSYPSTSCNISFRI